MKKQELDRIIVKSDARMNEIIDWYFDNADWLNKEIFRAPMESGLIIMEEAEIGIGFESQQDGMIKLSLYLKNSDVETVTWLYRSASAKIFGERFYVEFFAINNQSQKKLDFYSRQVSVGMLVYHALMLFAAYYEEIVEVDAKQNVMRTRHEAKKLRTNPKQPLNLVRKTYVVKDFTQKDLHKHGEKRKYTKPEHEVQVRGYYRTYKSGKRVWVKPFSRYKGNSGKKLKEYRV